MKGSRTEKNLMTAFMLESQARTLYTFFASAAEKEGYHQICRIFLEVADNERIHAKSFIRHFPGGSCEIKMTCQSEVVGTTIENLKLAISDEANAQSKLYPEFAKVAREEGFEDVARLFLNVAIAEKLHERMFRKLLKNIEEGTVWKRGENTTWICTKCGFNFQGTEPPPKCPACQHPREYFEILIENF